jgi:hypothetical protein
VGGVNAVKMGRKSTYNSIDQTKQCSTCKEIKNISEFYSDNRNLYDKYRHKCKKCMYADSKRWCLNNKKKASESRKRSYEKNKDKYSSRKINYNRIYRHENRDKVRKYFREYQKKRLQSDIQFKIRHIALRRIRSSIYRRNCSINNRVLPIFQSLGYTPMELMKHLESQFFNGMNWDNYGQRGWTIDHKIPDSNFFYKSTDDQGFKESYKLSNLQPMWAMDNYKKGSKLKCAIQKE